VDELKFKLSESLRGNRFKSDSNNFEMKQTVRKGSKSRSIGKKENMMSASNDQFSGSFLDDKPERLMGSSKGAKMYNQPDNEPMWAKTLKKHAV
jgi:hypothetical protein